MEKFMMTYQLHHLLIQRNMAATALSLSFWWFLLLAPPGILGDDFMELVSSVPAAGPSHQLSAIYACQSFPVLLGNGVWPQDPWAILLFQAHNASSLASSAAGENAMHVSGDPGHTESSAFSVSSCAANHLAGAAALALLQWNDHSFPSGDS